MIGDLDDGPEQLPLPEADVRKRVLSLLPERHFDLIVTHSPYGEYTRHRRHEETGKAVAVLWEKGLIDASEIWMFAYEDGGKGGRHDPPKAIKTAHLTTRLPEDTWRSKLQIIKEIYGFAAGTFEADIVMREEAFWRFQSHAEFRRWLKLRG